MDLAHLRGSLEYTEKLLSLGERIVFDVTREVEATFPEDRFLASEAISFDGEGENWIQIRRLQETRAPTPDPKFTGWIDGDLNVPTKEPSLRKEQMCRLDAETISSLIEKGQLLRDDVLEPLKPDPHDRKDVILRLERMPDLRSEWQTYLTDEWRPWAESERPKRRVIDLYGRLYQIHQRMVSFGEDNPLELVMGIGIACWRSTNSETSIVSPIIEQPLETELEGSGVLLLRPRNVNPSINLKPFHALNIESSEAVQRNAAATLQNLVNDQDVVFSPFNLRSFEAILRLCVAGLSPKARYFPEMEPQSRSLPEPSEHLIVTNTWIICARQRTEDIRRDDLKRLMAEVEHIESDEAIPGCARSFVRRPENKTTYMVGFDIGDGRLRLPDSPAISMRGVGGSSGRDQATGKTPVENSKGVFFPLPFNDEQIEIITTLEQPETHGVVVQGPPGTGKTHTIANIICHYLALGKNVLVTAKTAEALHAVQDKLPQAIRNLAISVVHDDRDGARQLEAAMTLLSNEAKQIRPDESEREIRAKQDRLASIKARREEIEQDFAQIARNNLELVRYQGRELTPMRLAEEVIAGEREHGWFPDQTTITDGSPRFDRSTIPEIVRLRRELGDALQYSSDRFPDPTVLPSWSEVVRTHEVLQGRTRIEADITTGNLPLMLLENPEDRAGAREIIGFLDRLETLRRVTNRTESKWLERLVLAGMRLHDDNNQFASSAITLLERWVALGERGSEFHRKRVHVGTAVYTIRELDEPIDKLASGKSPFGWTAIGKGSLKRELDTVLLEDRPPAGSAEWSLVKECRQWHSEVSDFVQHWNNLADRVRFFRYKDYGHAAKIIVPTCHEVKHALHVLRGYKERRAAIARLLPYGVDVDELFRTWEAERVRGIIELNLQRLDTDRAASTKKQLSSLVANKDKTLPFYAQLLNVVEALGEPAVLPHDVARTWQSLEAEAARLSGLRARSAHLDSLTSIIAQAGAPNWAHALRNHEAARGAVVPDYWEASWEWACAKAFIGRISDRERTERLGHEQSQLDREERRLLADVVRLRTFLGLKQKLTNPVQSALNKFTSAVNKLGSGTGKSAPRYRRVIRNSTAEASEAIPCWIMPEWRVSEQLPPKLGMFELVIVDEASQSDITALPAILRGKKLLVVGDDKQVSPSTVGIEERQIIQLRNTYLSGHPYADQMDPASSLYDLASVVFPGKSIMLREHFRCVEPIIRFSSLFYQQPLIPLRIPTASERLEPPLIDIFVKGGARRREVNEAEASVIVEEIRRIAQEQSSSPRTIGVISLIADKQARRIHDLLLRNIGPELLQRHKVLCGNAATFQGQERDIMFLSMVECPQTSTSKTTRVFEQRFNVAMSRARDRLVLVRSVEAADLKPNDLKRRIIDHVRNPMEHGKIGMTNDVLELCDSDFEREVGKVLIVGGYRLRSQVGVAGYKLDFVVEGNNDRRLAIECDGDQYHGPDRWPADMHRQRCLERMGWTFWRVWGSHWRAERDACITDLHKTLERLGIEPIGATPSRQTWTEHRIIDLSEEKGAEQGRPAVASAGISDVHRPEMIVPLAAAAPGRPSPSPDRPAVRTRSADTPLDLFQFRELSATTDRESKVQVGDTVDVRYMPENKVRRYRISDTENKPTEGVISKNTPLGHALLGAAVDEEVEYELDEETRVVVVQSILPHGQSAAA